MTLQPFRVAPVQPWISPDGVLVPLLTTHLDAFGLPCYHVLMDSSGCCRTFSAKASSSYVPNQLHKCELMLNLWAVSTTVFITPHNYWSIWQHSSKCTLSRLNLLNTLELILDWWAVTTIPLMTPGDNWSICQNRSKCTRSGLNLYVVAWDSALDLRLARRQRAVTKH